MAKNLKNAGKAQITKAARPGFVAVITPYNPDFVDNLKITIPHPHRIWDGVDKHWLISESYVGELVKLLNIYYTEITTDIGTEEQPTTPQNLFKSVFELLPDDYLAKVYMALAQAVHPDHGGTTEMMTQLNQAYQERKQ